MTPLPVSIAAAVASFLLLVIVFELIRSRRLRERYALLWLLTGHIRHYWPPPAVPNNIESRAWADPAKGRRNPSR